MTQAPSPPRSSPSPRTRQPLTKLSSMCCESSTRLPLWLHTRRGPLDGDSPSSRRAPRFCQALPEDCLPVDVGRPAVEAVELHFEPQRVSRLGTDACPHWTFVERVEAVQLHRIRKAPPAGQPTRPSCHKRSPRRHGHLVPGLARRPRRRAPGASAAQHCCTPRSA